MRPTTTSGPGRGNALLQATHSRSLSEFKVESSSPGCLYHCALPTGWHGWSFHICRWVKSQNNPPSPQSSGGSSAVPALGSPAGPTPADWSLHFGVPTLLHGSPPQQLLQDVKSFWSSTSPSELKSKGPHVWGFFPSLHIHYLA